MFLPIFISIFVCVSTRDLVEPKFQVLTPNELMVIVPKYENVELVTFRIGVKREHNENEDLELGENDIDNSRIFIYDPRLNLKKEDTINYLLAFRDGDGYQAQTGKYIFDGAYYKKPYGRRHRFRRHIVSTTQKSDYNTEEDTEEFDPVEPRFGGGFPRHHHPRRNWPPSNGFNPFGPSHGRHPPFSPFPPNQPPPFRPPSFGPDCNDHRHDMCHNENKPDNERWEMSTKNPKNDLDDVEYHCKICEKYSSRSPESTTVTTTTTTTEDAPEIDIRFSN